MEKIKIGEQVLDIDPRPVTIICQSPESALGPKIEYLDRLALEPEYTLYHAQRVQKLDPDFGQAWQLFHRTVSKHDVPVPTADEVRQMGTGAIHLMGLIDMSLKFCRQGRPVAWVHPESFMHPAWQAALGDLAIYFYKKFTLGDPPKVQ